MLHESDGMRTRRRRESGNRQAERLPDSTARLVTFTITAVTRSGRTKTTRMRILTTLLDHRACPAAEIAVLYSERWQIEIAFLHLKRTVRGPRRPLRGQSPDLARQEACALKGSAIRQWFDNAIRCEDSALNCGGTPEFLPVRRKINLAFFGDMFLNQPSAA